MEFPFAMITYANKEDLVLGKIAHIPMGCFSRVSTPL